MAPQQTCQEKATHQNSQTRQGGNSSEATITTLKELQSPTAEIGVSVHRTTLSPTQSPALWSGGLKVVLWTDTPISALELCSSFRVIFGLFVASLINALLVWSVSFGGRPSLGRCVVVPYSFHFLIMDLMVLRGMFKVWDIFYNPTLICLSSQLCPWPVWRAPWSSWCHLLGGAPCFYGVAESGAFQNRCVYIPRSCDT